ncbi:Nucleotidyltransferase family protein isoform 1 [Tripterygium wilfordii]|uniref:polynucleotide adenylyltransferase n=1 Tax=Tripterygium wilfordii TaxID=458696 RepID=A0A7J7C936_TRIWF|nr:terminal nucleotidyltransferase 4B-like [Tripterygium wilfordii]KAF5730671.1 Nucleotidyltransferase family protein isoform 1 [Tripterygium wilfordii]
MDGGDTETQTPIYLYETLTPFSLGTAPTTPDVQSPLSDDALEPYSVFRNEISLSTLDAAVEPDPAAPDFFSLNVGEPEPELVTPASALAEPVTPVRGIEPRLESAWWFSGNSRFKSPMLQLHKEIVDFCDFLSPTPEEQASRGMAVESVFGVIKYIWPNCRVEVFGSFKTGLYLPTSDIDVVILGSGIRNPQPGLQALSRALSQRGIAKKIQVIARARVPIIKFVEKKSGVAFDVSFDVQNGPVAADFIKDAVSKWPPLRPLCLILKVFLQQRELNEVYSGGIGSYALLAMLIAMLQCLRESHPVPEHNLGVLLVHFFDFYGRKLNTADVGVSCNGAGIFFPKSSRGFMNKGRTFLISIEDPQAPENDIGKNSFNYFQIRSAFGMAFSTLTNPKTILGLGPNRSILGTIIRPDPVLLERKGGSTGEMTFDSLLPGAGEPLQLHNGDKQGILYNWQYEDEEDPLPRGDGIAGDGSAQSSGKKRKSSSRDKSGKKKMKENGELQKARHEESSSRREKGTKKKRWRHNNDDVHRRSRSR